MFNAQAARKLSENSNKALIEVQLKQIFHIIEKAASEGKREVIVTIRLLPEVRGKLIELDYKIQNSYRETKFSGEVNFPTITISW